MCLSCGERRERGMKALTASSCQLQRPRAYGKPYTAIASSGARKRWCALGFFPLLPSVKRPLCSFLVLSAFLSFSRLHTHTRALDLDLLGSAVEIERTLEWLG